MKRIFLAGVFALVLALIFSVVLFGEKESPNPEKVFTLKEKFGQMLLIGMERDTVTPEFVDLFKKIKPGGILLLSRNIKTAEQTRELIGDLQTIARQETALPLFIAVDQEGGIVGRVPWAEDTAQSELRDVGEAFSVGKQRGRELQELGINMNLAPVLDSNQRGDFLFSRSFQRDAAKAAELADGLISGHAEEGVISVAKHFPGYDGIGFNPETETIPSVARIPDHAAFGNINAKFVMVSHVVYRDLDEQNPFPFSKAGSAFLKRELGDEVIVMSDDLLSRAFVSEFELGEIGERAVWGGIDVLLLAGYPYPSTIRQLYEETWEKVQQDKELQSFVERSGEKIIRLKQTTNL